MDRSHHGTAFHGGEHYENFPVGSWLVPAEMRSAILALYRFARTGDDLADEGALSTAERLKGLHALESGLRRAPMAGNQDSGLWAIGASLRTELDGRDIGIEEPLKLLAAFVQDAHNRPLQTEAEVLEYCSRSANPVGRLFLALAGLSSSAQWPAMSAASDAICTGLQLANFAQDMAQDISRQRVYVPDRWWLSCGCADRTQIGLRRPGELVRRMAQWAHESLRQGDGLAAQVRTSGVPGAGRLAVEVALCVEGGSAIAEKALRDPDSVWTTPPRISRRQLPMLLLRSLRLAYASPRERHRT